ncbi:MULTISPECIES: plasmid replication initiator RepA [Serratia]|uniref:plasmid replication initiator RepA n=1 Tax=Serratia TaxID=613 RepID=UPI001F5513C6|nr:plasmid replication initiator RepA [Serratia marcescens]
MFTKYVSNPTPAFLAPQSYEERPDFVRKLFDSASNRKVWLWVGFYGIQPLDPATDKPISRQRFFNSHRAQAIQAITLGIIYHLDVITGIARISVEQLAQQCGLSTKSGAITRASRAVVTLEQYGLLKCEKERGREGARAQKRIEITPLFIDMCGVNPKEFVLAQVAAKDAIKVGVL